MRGRSPGALHDGCPVACWVMRPSATSMYSIAHVNVGFFHGAALADPAHLLQGTGKFHAPCEAEIGNGHKRRGARQADRDGVLRYKGARRNG